MKDKIQRYPRGKFGEIKNSSISLENIKKIRDNLDNYSKELQSSLNEKDYLTKKEIKEVEDLNRILINKEKYEADQRISKKAIDKNVSKVQEFDEIINFMEEENIEIYNPSEFIDISEVEEIK